MNLTRKYIFLFLWCVLGFNLVYSQSQEYTISGYVRDSSSGEALIGATVFIKETQKGALTNDYGFFSIKVPHEKFTLVVKYLGYVTYAQTFQVKENVKVIIELQQEAVSTEEVVITDIRADENIKSVEMSVQKIDIQTIKTMPAFFGEVDVLRSIQLLPGVVFAGDGNTGFYVRGGGADQNLVLLDEAVVYNASHLLGFFSVFNSDAIKDVTLYKGGMPAQYGGRLSAVLDIKMNEGNNKKYVVKGGIGTIASRLTVEGPIVKEKGSFILSGRRTYADLFLKLSKNPRINQNKLFFYDFNAKANYEINEKNRVFISGYFGKDVFDFGNEFGFLWGNSTLTSRWNHQFNTKLFMNNSVIFSDFKYQFNIKQTTENVQYTSGATNLSLKTDLDFFWNDKLHLKFGQQAFYHSFLRADLKPTGQSNITPYKLPIRHGYEQALYISNDHKISTKINMKYGLRYSFFADIGPTTIYTFANPRDNRPIDTTVIQFGKILKSYHGLEPRWSLNYGINEQSSIKTSYARTRQYLNLVSNAASSLPTDIWIPASSEVKPQIADQIAAGYFRNFMNNQIESSLELYYKKLQNQIEFQPDANLFLNPQLEKQLAFGKGWSYGLELFIKKNSGKWTGWVGYTLSWTYRQMPIINHNEPYFAKNDRRHDCNVVLSYDYSARWNFSLTWIFASGNSISFPTGKYELDGHTILRYDKLYNDRMPDYHRMDLSITFKNKPGKKFESSWNLSVYNLYARKNTWAFRFEKDPNDESRTRVIKIYLFSIIPSITFNFRF